LLANTYLDALDKELERRGHKFCRYADDCNIYVSSQAAAERTLTSIQEWIEKRLRLKVNPAKSGTGRVWERKFLGFQINRKLQIGIAPESIKRFKAKVRELLRGRQSRTSNELRDVWKSFIQGWWGYFQLAEDRRSILRLEGSLGLKGLPLNVAASSRGAWHLARTGSLQKALSNAVIRKAGFLVPSNLAAMSS
jgi:hypothetical protein